MSLDLDEATWAPNRQKRREAMAYINLAGEARTELLRRDISYDLETRLRLKRVAHDALMTADILTFEARIHGFKLPG